jgi:hypothetical protein
LGVAVALAGIAMVFGCVTASAFAAGPRWALTSVAAPRSFAPADGSGHDQLLLEAVDVGNAKAEGSVTIADTLPAGLTAVSIAGEGAESTCTLTPLSCVFTEGPQPAHRLAVVIHVDVQPDAPVSLVNEASVTGGSAGAATASDAVQITSTPVGFGIERYGLTATNDDGSADVQAGSHPYELTAEAGFNQALDSEAKITVAGSVDTLHFELPPGVTIDAQAAPQCVEADFVTGGCSNGTAVGAAMVSAAGEMYPAAVYDLEPSPGEPARLGFVVDGVPFFIDTALLAGSDGMTMSINHMTQVVAFAAIRLELWGVPADPSHDATRGRCLSGEETDCESQSSPTAFLTLPTSCAGPSSTTLQGDSWQEPGVFLTESFAVPALTGCQRLPFEPALAVAPDVNEADTPSGFTLDLKLPQSENPTGLASSGLKNATIDLPEGTNISLSATDGLQTCSMAQVGLGSTAQVTCPNASKVGEVNIRTPVLGNPLQGAVYMATPNENPFSSPLAVYVVAEDPVSGVQVKLAGQLEPNPATGQLTIALRELPQLPIGDLQLHFFGGERAFLSTPPVCGPATSTGELTPWSGSAGVTSSSTFDIDQGVNGTPCSDSGLFSPTFQVGSAGTGESDTYGSLNFTVTRADQEEPPAAIAIQAPAALAQMFAGVPPCEEPRAAQGTCSAASALGTVAAQAGPGYDAVALNGEVYLTGAYGGASQGLEIVLPVDPGPLQLGDAIVRMSAQIEPGTHQLRIAGSLPSIADGVPLQIKELQVQLDRELRISPDGCEPLTVTGTITGTRGGSATTATEPWGAAASSCPPAAPAPAATTNAATSTRIALSLAGTRLSTTARGEVAVKLKCTDTTTCRGRLSLTVKTRARGKKRFKTDPIGTATFSIPPGKTATIKLELNAAGRALLSSDHGRLSATLTLLKSSPEPAQTRTEGVVLLRPKAVGVRKR